MVVVASSFFNTIPSQAWYYNIFLKFHLQNYKLFQIETYIMIPFTSRVFKRFSEPLWYDMMMMMIESWKGIMITYKKDKYLFRGLYYFQNSSFL